MCFILIGEFLPQIHDKHKLIFKPGLQKALSPFGAKN